MRSTSKKRGLHRLALVTAALGVLVMSSGAALLATAGPAAAANPVGICHATSSDSNPYTFITVDDDSVKASGHLAHRETPDKTWKDAGYFNGVFHAAGAPKPDLIGSFTDDQGVFHTYDGNITAASCDNHVLVATANVTFNDPSCANKNVVSYDTSGNNVTFAITAGSNTPGAHIEVTATANGGAEFAGGATTQVFKHDYKPAVDLNAAPCATADATAAVTFLDPTCALPNRADYTTSGNNVTFAITQGSKTPGTQIQVTATAVAGHTFADLTTSKVFTHAYPASLNPNGPPCVIIANPGDVKDATAVVNFIDPTCVNQNLADYTTGGQHVTFAITSGSKTPGAAIEVTATADAGHAFADNTLTKTFTHQYAAALNLNGPPCTIVNPPGNLADATAAVDFIDPSCDVNSVDYATSGNNVTFAVTNGSETPGQAIEVTATADAGHTFADLSTTKKFTHTYGDLLDLNAVPCVDDIPVPPIDTPVIDTPQVEPPVPTLVHAGLVDDLRAVQGRILIAAGALMLLVGGAGMFRTRDLLG